MRTRVASSRATAACRFSPILLATSERTWLVCALSASIEAAFVPCQANQAAASTTNTARITLGLTDFSEPSADAFMLPLIPERLAPLR